MVRIETSVLRTTVDDIQFLFRGYDLDSISPVVSNDSTTPLPSCFTELTESLGWNMNSKGNVGCLVEGTHAPRQHHAQLIKDKDKKETRRAKRHTFVVRFATPADARMAVRDKQGSPIGSQQYYEKLAVAQYPRQW
mmetsp:Transcript_42313/g.74201  ORF Transcript_42313/g.74201 Transcript_42313/m.74201 type:complete len:136 (-) Transcript_42313:36-443(-)